MINKIWNLISNHQVPNNASYLEKENKRLLNQYNLFLCLIFLIFSVRDFVYSVWEGFFVLASISLGLLVSFIFTKVRFNRYVLLGFYIILLGLIFYYSSLIGIESGIIFYYFPLITSLSYIFEWRKDKYTIIFIISLTVILFLYNHFTNYQIFYQNSYNESNKSSISTVSILNSLTITLLNYIFSIRKNALIVSLYKSKLHYKSLISHLKSHKKTNSINPTQLKKVVNLAVQNDISFLSQFKETYPSFIKNLLQIQPDLNNGELKFCAYLLLNFSSKDIAEYTYVTHRAVQIRKNRLRKKLNIPSDTDLYIWIHNQNNFTE